MKKRMFAVFVLASLFPLCAAAQEVMSMDCSLLGQEDAPTLDSSCYDDAASAPDESNTGATGNGDNTVNVADTSESGGEELSEDQQNDIWIERDSTTQISRVFANGNLVEPVNVIGQTGEVEVVNSDTLRFRPLGRVPLLCKAKDGQPGWFGPCTVEEGAAAET